MADETLPSVCMTRGFSVPVERVFAAWTEPALLQKWGVTRATLDALERLFANSREKEISQ
jgi:uncharacterized protein YndB with AHSA1/START domain